MQQQMGESATRSRIMLCGIRASLWRAVMEDAGFEARVSLRGPWETELERFDPHLLLVHEVGFETVRAVKDIRTLQKGRSLPLVVVLDDNEEKNELRSVALDAGADEVIFESHGASAVVQAARLLVGTTYSSIHKSDEQQDPVTQALDLAAGVGDGCQEEEEETLPRLSLNSSLVQAIDLAQRNYAQEMERRPENLQVREARARAAISTFCNLLDVPVEASVHMTKRAAAQLLQDLDLLTSLGPTGLALRLAAQSVLFMEEDAVGSR